ncbi:MAG: T9SS type A sorting domain-containing protein [Bacteroidota bacterium]
MKKFFLLLLTMSVGMGLFAQKLQVNKSMAKPLAPVLNQQLAIDPIGSKEVYLPAVVSCPESALSPNAVSVIDLGTSINAIGLSGGGRTVLWADNNANSISFFHRMVGDVITGGRVAMDISTDGGATWGNNAVVYTPLGPPLPGQTYAQAAGRYPQGVLFNPSGNTHGNSTYGHYFIPTLDGSNPGTAAGVWGGYAWGVRKGDTTALATQHNLASGNGYLHNVPDAFTLVGNKSFMVETSLLGGIGTAYNDTLVMGRGVWNTVTNDFDYTWEKMYVPTDWYVADTKIAFAPDGLTGFIAILAHNPSKPLSDSTYFPILGKTIDGGLTWTGPINIDLYGANGVPEVKQYVSDSLLTAMFTTMPDRDSVVYTTMGNCDLVVDMNGNPHLGVVVSLSTGDHSTYFPKTCSVFDLYSLDGGNTWKGVHLDTISNQYGSFGSGTTVLTEDNRVQLSRTQDGSKVFVSWIDTQPPASPAANTAPNIFVRGINMWNLKMTPVLNVTKFTLAYTQAYMATQSHFVFSAGNSCGIPFVYQAMNPVDATQAVQYKYIHNYKILDTQYTLDLGSPVMYTPSLEVSQNYPNPCHGNTTIGVELVKSSTVSVEVSNLLGQKVISLPAQTLSNGVHEIKLDLSHLGAGAYFYTVTVGKERITKKMIVN